MSESFSVDCPVWGRTIIVTGIIASCGKCGVATGASDAKESWDNVSKLD